jgi:hypothetical protein
MDSVAAIEEAADEARADEAADAGDRHRLMVCRAAYHLRVPRSSPRHSRVQETKGAERKERIRKKE